MQLTEGPFAETDEVPGGYYLIDVADLDAAVAWAARIPSASDGSIDAAGGRRCTPDSRAATSWTIFRRSRVLAEKYLEIATFQSR
jgi:hypothetical protein